MSPERPGTGPGFPPAGGTLARPGAWARWWAPLGLIGLVAAAYGQTLGFDFVWDDHYFLSSKPAIQSWTGWHTTFTSPISEYMAGMRGTERMYRPVHALIWAADRGAWGLHPAGFHLASVLAHLAAVLLVWRLAGHLTGSSWVGVAAGALLAVHPSAVEAVAFVSARMDIFVGLAIAAVLLLLRGCSGLAGMRRLAGALLCFAGALGSKETAMVIPAIVTWGALVYPGWFAGPGTPPRRTALLGRVAPFWVVLGGYAVLRRAVLGSLAPVPINVADLPGQALRALAVVASYGQMTVIPGPPTGIITMQPPTGLTDGRALLGLAVVGLLLAGLAWLPSRHPGAALTLGIYVAVLVPLSNLVPAYWKDVPHIAERGLYPALVGWCLFLAIGLHALAARPMVGVARSRRLMVLGGGSVVGILLVVTALKASAWRDEVTLWTSAVVSDPGSAMARLNLATALGRAGDLQRGETVAREAAALFPADPFLAYQAGWFAEARGDVGEALGKYERAIALGVGQEAAFRRAAMAAARLREWDRAGRWIAAAADRYPQAAWPQAGLGWLHQRRGRIALAREHFDRAARLEPNSPEPPWFLGQLLAAEGRTGEAAEAYRAVLRLDSSFVPARRELAFLAEREGRLEEATVHWRRLAASLPGRHRGEALAHLRRLEGAGGVAAPGGSR